ncbi:MAG: ergothioneine biosynthesis protein EgtB [Bacteroidetes bacterium]|nr:ergothioneine biosynthesis protein EgtB [Bacteroidota bacterium]
MGLLDEFLKTRVWTEKLVDPLTTDDMVVQPASQVSPPKWHLAHSSWFFEHFILKAFVKEYKEYHPDFDYLFHSGLNGMGEGIPLEKRGTITRPDIKEVFFYRQHVSEAMSLFWEQLEKHTQSADIMKKIELGVQHEQHHQELLLADIKYILGNQFLHEPYVKKEAPDTGWYADKILGWNQVDKGMYTIGHENGGFCFDNERAAHNVSLQAFEMADRAIVNHEYLEFIEAGGYENFNLWLRDGWDWVKRTGAAVPMYWKKIDGKWQRYSLQGVIDVEENGPLLHVNYYEADAFARWKGARLPTEFEWEAAFQVNPDWMYSPVWEWCASAYLPYPGFKITQGALGEYKNRFMVGQMVLRGASLATPEGHWRPSYRSFLYPDAQWHFSGIRLVR